MTEEFRRPPKVIGMKMLAAAHALAATPVHKVYLQDFSADRPNHKWVSDITYIATDEGWLYLAVVVDLYSRLVVGWSMSERMTAALVCDALRMAVFGRQRPCGVIVQSDRENEQPTANSH